MFLSLGMISTIRRETDSYKWTLLSIGYNTGIAWLAAFVIYNGGRLFGFA